MTRPFHSRLDSILHLLATGTSIVLASWLFFDRVSGTQIEEPLSWDECLTLENYSWAAFEPDGVPKRIRRADELTDLPPPTFVQLAAGIYRAFGVWREPNDHIPHSVLVNATLAVFSQGARAPRLAAWLGALVFAATMACLCRQAGFRLAWPLALMLAAACPYVHTYALQARGYSWMLALQGLLLMSAHRLAARPSSIRWGGMCALLAVLTVWNIVSLALDWLVPLYLALWLSPPPSDDSASTGEHLAGFGAYRRNILVQGLVVGFVGLVFLIDHLPYVFVSVQEFGLPTARGEFLKRCLEICDDLLPNLAWKSIGFVGASGWLLMIGRRTTRRLGSLCLLTLAVSLAHFLLAARFPYPRTCGYFIPLLVLGVAHAAERLLQAVQGGLVGGLRLVMVFAIALFATTEHVERRRAVSALAGYRQELRRQLVPGRPYVVITDEHSYIWVRHLPPSYLAATDEPTQIAQTTSLGFLSPPTDTAAALSSEVAAWPLTGAGSTQLRSCPATAHHLEGASAPGQYPVVVVWIPDATRTGIRNERLYAAIEGLSVEKYRHHRTVFNKLEFSNQVYAVEFVLRNQPEFQEVADVVRNGWAKLGGEAMVVEPTSGCIDDTAPDRGR